jgi:aminopeptidase N
MVSNRYGDPQTRFMSSDNVYSKGGFILNMLRARLGDDAFFKGSALYLDRYHLACTETDDFRKCLEATSGQSLERFFDQWVRRPGHPAIDVDLAWDESNSTLTVKAAQTQTINADNPAYAFTLPIYVDLGDDKKSQYVYLDMDGKTAQGSFKLDKKPADVSIDPYLTLLVTSKIAQPLAGWLRILEHGPTLAARIQAADALADFSDPRAVAALNAVASNPDDTELLREVAGDSLAAIGGRALGNSVARVLASLPVIQGSVHMQPGASR